MRYSNNRNNNNNKNFKPKKKVCFFCAEKISEIDYKDAELLKRFLTMQSKIASRKRTGTCAKHQRELANAIKKARVLAIVPFVSNK